MAKWWIWSRTLFGFSSKSGPDTDTPMMDFMEMVMVGDDSNLKGVTTITWAILNIAILMMSNTTFETQESLDSEKVAFASGQADFSNPNRQLHTAFITKTIGIRSLKGSTSEGPAELRFQGAHSPAPGSPLVSQLYSSKLLTVPQKGVMNLCWKMMKRQQISPTLNLLSGVLPISHSAQNQKRKQPTSSSSLFKASKSSGPKTLREHLEFRGKIQRSGEQSA